MSQRFDMRVVSKFKKGTPKVLKRIASSRDAGNKEFPVDQQFWGRFPVNGFEEHVFITPPENVDVRWCWIAVKSKADVDAKCRVEENQWEIAFPYSDDPNAESPVTVNVTIIPPEDEEMEPGGNPPPS